MAIITSPGSASTVDDAISSAHVNLPGSPSGTAAGLSVSPSSTGDIVVRDGELSEGVNDGLKAGGGDCGVMSPSISASPAGREGRIWTEIAASRPEGRSRGGPGRAWIPGSLVSDEGRRGSTRIDNGKLNTGNRHKGTSGVGREGRVASVADCGTSEGAQSGVDSRREGDEAFGREGYRERTQRPVSDGHGELERPFSHDREGPRRTERERAPEPKRRAFSREAGRRSREWDGPADSYVRRERERKGGQEQNRCQDGRERLSGRDRGYGRDGRGARQPELDRRRFHDRESVWVRPNSSPPKPVPAAAGAASAGADAQCGPDEADGSGGAGGAGAAGTGEEIGSGDSDEGLGGDSTVSVERSACAAPRTEDAALSEEAGVGCNDVGNFGRLVSGVALGDSGAAVAFERVQSGNKGDGESEASGLGASRDCNGGGGGSSCTGDSGDSCQGDMSGRGDGIEAGSDIGQAGQQAGMMPARYDIRKPSQAEEGRRQGSGDRPRDCGRSRDVCGRGDGGGDGREGRRSSERDRGGLHRERVPDGRYGRRERSWSGGRGGAGSDRWREPRRSRERGWGQGQGERRAGREVDWRGGGRFLTTQVLTGCGEWAYLSQRWEGIWGRVLVGGECPCGRQRG